MDTNSYRIVLNSMGEAGVALVRSLRPVIRSTDKELVEKLYQAPSVLLDSLDLSTAQQVMSVLNETGAEFSLESCADVFTPGEGNHEIAISVTRYDRIAEVIKVISELIGTDVKQALEVLTRSPSVLLSNVSEATVEVFRKRLADLSVDVFSSQPKTALYDLFYSGPAENKPDIVRSLRSLGVVPAGVEINNDANSPVICTGASFDFATRMWEYFRDGEDGLAVLNQNYQTFDLQLTSVEQSGEPSADLSAYLSQHFGIPEKVIPKILNTLPVVIARNVQPETLAAHMVAISGLDAQCEGHLTTYQSYNIELDNKDTDSIKRAATTLSLLTSALDSQWESDIRNTQGKPNMTLNYHQGRWAAHELKQQGIRNKLRRLA